MGLHRIVHRKAAASVEKGGIQEHTESDCAHLALKGARQRLRAVRKGAVREGCGERTTEDYRDVVVPDRSFGGRGLGLRVYG